MHCKEPIRPPGDPRRAAIIIKGGKIALVYNIVVKYLLSRLYFGEMSLLIVYNDER